MFSCEFCELFKNTCFVEDLQTAGFETPGRSSHPEVFCEKGVLKIWENSQEDTCARVSFLIKLQAGACKFIKKETLAQESSCGFCKISKNTFFYRTPLVAASDQSGGVSSIKLQD